MPVPGAERAGQKQGGLSMSVATIMVHLDLGGSNEALVRIAGELAERCNAKLVAIAACQSILAMPASAAFVSGEAVAIDEAETARQMQEAEAEFRDVLAGRPLRLEWRSAMLFAPLSDHLVSQARCADLIITAPGSQSSLSPNARRTNVSDVVMQAGRPVLLVPHHVTSIPLDHAVVAWKEGRAARRASLDAIPLLKLAKAVTIAEIVEKGNEAQDARQALQDVSGWFAEHKVEAQCLVEVAKGPDARSIAHVAHDLGADLIVAGAYGHNRLREWILGGVTRDFLLNPPRPVLLSH
ncbi:universal stress protein [Sphingobium nicotianae]|uniref:Universal stress protein n=1 Tax=Sphingobium nicotianae TaxID=2782607 RepID=A0A9X1DF34_9SPHN|nr:universal stress protein [Sphingobium nicotianae]MBT2189047.1 universal stress protein [Sphingobium nicotianae]